MKSDLIALIGEAQSNGNPSLYHDGLCELLSAHSFYNEHPEPALNVGNSVFDLRPPAFARAVLSKLHNETPEELFSKIMTTFAIDKVELESFAFVENIMTDKIIDLGDNVIALPEADAPSPSFLQRIAEAKGPLVSRQGLILRSIKSTKALKKSSAPAGHPIAVKDRSNPGEEAIRKAIRLLTLDGPSAPQSRVWHFKSATDLGIFEFREAYIFEYPQRLPLGMPPQITAKMQILLPQYDGLTNNHRKRVDAAIGRLNLGASETAIADRIVEAAIAIEAVLSDDDKQELTYRYRLRSALLLETTYEKRKAIKGLVRRLYDERSRLVHTGLPGNADDELAREALELAARIIERILEIGNIPDWDTIELTGGDISQAIGPQG